MRETFFVHLDKVQHVFCAAHFITYGGATCEPIHGHNYRVQLDVEGPLDENHYVVDFTLLDRWLGEIVADLDHHVLLPTKHPLIRIATTQDEVEVRFQQRRWLFPRSECALLPVANTTAELLARYIADRVLRKWEANALAGPRVLRIAVDECNGQWGGVELRTTEQDVTQCDESPRLEE